jgi:ElaB/YqjD/DUF883 family membrane-anchored ribosome-binding protein
MDTEEIKKDTQRALRQAGDYVQNNPAPAIFGALVVGIAIGLLARALEKEDRPRLQDRLEDTEEYLRSVLKPLAKRSKSAYAKSADAVRDAVERARDLEVDDYTAPVVSWWQRFWKKCCD